MTRNRKGHDKGSQFVRYFGPLLEALRGLGGSGTPDEVVERIANDVKIPDAVQNEILPSGSSRLRKQIAWARFYLTKEGLLDASQRGVWSLTEKGRTTKLTLSEAQAISDKWVRIFQAQRRAAAISKEGEPDDVGQVEAISPADYRSEVIELLLGLPAAGFERLSQRLLREAGFTQVVVTGRSGDEGIDGYGTLQINALVSFKVLFQCKRYRKSVSPSHVRDFRGAMAGRADKGIIVTTGTFTAEARREAQRDGVPPIELVDGEKLVDMLANLELGLKPVTAYRIDESFFDEFKTS